MQPLAWKKEKRFFVQSYKSRARDLDLAYAARSAITL